MIRFSTSRPFYLSDALEATMLPDEQKVYFRTRYMDLVTRYRQKYKRINTFYNTLRITVMVGSIFIPALLTLQKDPTTIISETTYWVVFGLSLCVTLSNSLLELFNVSALNTKYWLHVHRLETEGWQFLHLTEAYSKFDTVQDAFSKFSAKVEKLHLSLVFDLLRLENKNKSASSGVNNSDTSFSGGASLGNGNGSGSARARHGGNMFQLPRSPPACLETESLGTSIGIGTLDRETKPSDGGKPLVVSLHEFQAQLDDSSRDTNGVDMSKDS